MLHELKNENFGNELNNLMGGLELSAKSSSKLFLLGFKWMRKQLSSLARLFLSKPKLLRRHGPNLAEELQGPSPQNGLSLYQHPPSQNW